MSFIFGKNVYKASFRIEAIITMTVSVNLNTRTVVYLQIVSSSHPVCEIVDNLAKDKDYCAKGNFSPYYSDGLFGVISPCVICQIFICLTCLLT